MDLYPNIYIDHKEFPQKGYLQEIMTGVIQQRGMEKKGFLKRFITTGQERPTFVNNALVKYSRVGSGKTSLIVLDSAAGIGFYEFLKVKELMKNEDYFLILDDIDHLKHFRSRQYVERFSNEFELIGTNEEAGWLIARSIC